MSKIVEKAMAKLARQKSMLERLKNFKKVISSRAEHPEKNKHIYQDCKLSAWDLSGSYTAVISNDEVGEMLTPEVLLPIIDSVIEKLEKSNLEISGVFSVLEKAIEPTIAGDE